MNRLTIHIDVLAGKTIDLNRLQIVANDFMQKYVGKMYMYDAKDESVAMCHVSRFFLYHNLSYRIRFET